MNRATESFDDLFGLGCLGVRDLEHCEIGDGFPSQFFFSQGDDLCFSFCQKASRLFTPVNPFYFIVALSIS